MDGSGQVEVTTGIAVFRPHDLAARPPRRVRPRAEGQPATWPWTPTTPLKTWASPSGRGAPRSPRGQGGREAVRLHRCAARRGSHRGGARPFGPPVPRLRGGPGGGWRGVPAGRPSFRPATGRGVLAGLLYFGAITLHISMRSGRNTHHILEACFKAVARALRDAVRVEGGGVPSTKGVLG